jgi:glycine cleavage system regulatory protein
MSLIQSACVPISQPASSVAVMARALVGRKAGRVGSARAVLVHEADCDRGWDRAQSGRHSQKLGEKTLTQSLVLTLVGDDRPGLVEALSKAIATHGGNWEQGAMSRLAGKFAGILLVTVPEGQASVLDHALRELEGEGLRLLIEATVPEQASRGARELALELVGHDRPGIMRDISDALVQHGVNVEELTTACSSAPMSGERLFHARARLKIPLDLSLEKLRTALEALANDLMIDLKLVELPSE